MLNKAREFFDQDHIAERLGVSVRQVRRWEKGESRFPRAAAREIDDLLKKGTRVNEDEASYGGVRNGGASFSFIDLFAGIGGTRLGFEAAGGKCVFTSEWNRFAVQTYRANFGDSHQIEGDITKVPAELIPEHDVLVGGFPCQPFSLAGVSKKNSLGRAHGFLDETQGTLFFDIVRILEAVKPKAFLLENVKNLRGHDKGKTFRVIGRTLEALGYAVSSRIIDAASVVPQHRERIFIIGFRDSTHFDWDGLEWEKEGPSLESILHRKEESPEHPYSESFRGKCRVASKYTLSDHLWNYLQNYAEKHRAKGNGFGCSVVGPNDRARTLSARYHKDGSEILIRQRGKKNPRRLTPRECARIMGFPNSFNIPVSDTQAYKQFGNSVVVPVVERIARHLKAHLLGRVETGADRKRGAYQIQLPLTLN